MLQLPAVGLEHLLWRVVGSLANCH
jgi:hypothetical protein